jgi:hypothetical protein
MYKKWKGRRMMNKKILSCSFLLGIIIILGFITGCSLAGPVPPVAVPTEFSGSWKGAGPDIYTFTSLNISLTNTIVGDAEYEILSYDETAKHITTSFISGSGVYLLVPAGSVDYWTYSITGGNELFFDTSTSDFPVTATKGPFLKQWPSFDEWQVCIESEMIGLWGWPQAVPGLEQVFFTTKRF